MSKSKRDFIFSLILVLYALIMLLFFKNQFKQIFPVLYPLAGAYFAYNSLSIFVPSLNEFSGAKKPFKYYYIAASNSCVPSKNFVSNQKKAFIIFLFYFGLLTIVGWILSLYFSVLVIFFVFLLINMADYICVLFWCPFRALVLKNTCCTTCRITNWDRLMKFWILLFIPHYVSYILVTIGLIIFLHWEISIIRNPARFNRNTNISLRCYHCTQKTCNKKELVYD